MTDRVNWAVSPADLSLLSPFRYLVPFVVGAYVGSLMAFGIALAPALVARPPLLALVVLLALVGGPVSLLYLWPMIHDPAQRPDLESVGWLSTLRRGPSLVAALLGALLVPLAFLTVGWVAPYGLVVALLFLPLLLLGFVDVEGSIDPVAGTLTVNRRTVETHRIAGLSTRRIGSLAVIRLRYEPGTSRFGKPLAVVARTDDVGAIREALSDGIDAEPPESGSGTSRRDPLASAVLASVGVLFVGVGVVGALAVAPSNRPLLLGVTGSIGVPFLLAAYYVARGGNP
jgi:hypothetical protein